MDTAEKETQEVRETQNGLVYSRDDLTARVNQARAQAAREGKKTVLESLGFEDMESLKTFVEGAREAADAAKTETEKREAALAEREAALLKRETEAAAQALDLTKKNALAALGATGDNLKDAARLLDITADSTEDEIKTAAEALRKRHPGMFQVNTAPDVPQINTPPRPTLDTRPGDYGARMAEKYFGKKE